MHEDSEADAKLVGSMIEVDAYVVDIPNAAGFDCEGIVNPLLKATARGLLGIHIFNFATVKVFPALPL